MASNNSLVGRKCPPHRSQQLYLPPGSPPNILRNYHFKVFQGCFASHIRGNQISVDKVPGPQSDGFWARKRRGTEKGDCPGTIAVMGGPCAEEDQEKRGVINVFAQFCPGKPNRGHGPAEYKGITPNDGVLDDEKQRLKWFKATLKQIAQLPELESVAFPYQIGCGLAGGDWKQYRAALEEFAERVKERNVKVGGLKR